MDKWDNRFLSVATLISSWSKDPSTQVGCVIVDDNRRILSTGYNGFSSAVDDLEERLHNRDIKYPLTIHAEVNAVLNTKQSLVGATAYITHQPCCNCASVLIQSGIKRVVCYSADEALTERFKTSFELAEQILNEASVSYNVL